MRILQQTWIGLLVVWSIANSVAIANAQPEIEFPEDAFVAWEAGQQLLQDCGVHWQKTYSEIDQGVVETEVPCEFKCWNQLALYRWSAKKYQEFVGDEGKEFCRCVNDEYAFSICRTIGEDAWAIKNMKHYQSDADQLKAYDQFRLPVHPSIQNAFFRPTWPFTLVEFISHPAFSVNSVSWDKELFGKALVRVRFTIAKGYSSMEMLPAERGEFWFDPDRMWILVKYEFRFPNGMTHQGNNSDIRYCNGIYVAFRQEWEKRTASGKVRTSGSHIFDYYHVGKVPLHEFSLSAYGLPEISDRYKKPFPWLRIVILFVGIAVLVLGIWIRTRRN